MAVTINASTSSGLVQSADNSGIIQFQSNGVTKATLNSSGFSYPGAVLQVVQGTSTSAITTTTNTTVVSANITPTSASSKILILANVGFEVSGDLGHAYGNIQRNNSNIFVGDAAGSRPRATWAQNNSGGNGTVAFSMAYVDSPATTSSTTYGINVSSSNGTTVYINRSVRDNDGTAYDGRTVSSIILMEIAA